jgi:hypothetical protein
LKRAVPEDLVIVTDAEQTRPSKRARAQAIGEEEEGTQVSGEEDESCQEPKASAEPAIDGKLRAPARSLAGKFAKWIERLGKKKEEEDGSDGKEGDDEEGGDKEDDDEEVIDDGGVAVPTGGFIDALVDYQQNDRHSDEGQKLEKILMAESKRIAKHGQRALWRLWFCTMCIQLVRASKDVRYLETGDPEKERGKRHPRHACLILNEVVDRLWTTRRQRALVFYQFLAGKTFNSVSPRPSTDTR